MLFDQDYVKMMWTSIFWPTKFHVMKFQFIQFQIIKYCTVLLVLKDSRHYRYFQNWTGLGLEITKTRALNRGKEVTVKLPLCLKVTVLKWHNPFLLYIWRTIILIILMSSSLTSRLAFIQVQSGKCKIIELLYKNINHRNVFAFGCSLILLNNLVSTLDKNSI